MSLQELVPDLIALLGDAYVRTDETTVLTYGTDALKLGHPADAVVSPADTSEVAGVVRLCAAHGIPFVPR